MVPVKSKITEVGRLPARRLKVIPSTAAAIHLHRPMLSGAQDTEISLLNKPLQYTRMCNRTSLKCGGHRRSRSDIDHQQTLTHKKFGDNSKPVSIFY